MLSEAQRYATSCILRHAGFDVVEGKRSWVQACGFCAPFSRKQRMESERMQPDDSPRYSKPLRSYLARIRTPSRSASAIAATLFRRTVR